MGMLLALFNRFRGERLKAGCALVLAFWLAWLTQERFVMALAALFTLLLNPQTVGRPVKVISRVLSSRFSTWLADMSYPAYLIHFGFMTPAAYLCAQSEAFRVMPGPFRFAVVFVLTVIPTYLVSMVLFRYIEKNGIVWGKTLIKSLDQSSPVQAVEKIKPIDENLQTAHR
jgi:peptidoglycan/LPS O-acetylase OafA/YrhL